MDHLEPNLTIVERNMFDTSHKVGVVFLCEKVLQIVDCAESITNTPKSSNGFLLIREMSELALRVSKYARMFRRLNSVLSEAQDNNLKWSVVNDTILNKYFPDIVNHYKNVKLKEDQIHNFINESVKHLVRLENGDKYISFIEDEIISIVTRKVNTKDLDELLELVNMYISQLMYFDVSQEFICECVFSFINYKSNDVHQLFSLFRNRLGIRTVLIPVRSGEMSIRSQIPKSIRKETILKENVPFSDTVVQTHIPEDLYFVAVKFENDDIYSGVNNLYSSLLQKKIIEKDPMSLPEFTNFFDQLYQSTNITFDGDYVPLIVKNSPYNVKTRPNTFLKTLCLFNDKSIKKYLKDNRSYSSALYYYSMAVRAKSIENSIVLMWSALEFILSEYRNPGVSDIDHIKQKIARYLCQGKPIRMINSFRRRLLQYCSDPTILKDELDIDSIYMLNKESTVLWLDWFSIVKESAEDNRRYNFLKNYSELLAYEYCKCNDTLSMKNSSLAIELSKSKNTISFQLDRIYTHRNRFVHAASLLNEYSLVWHHLEWYVGKILAYCAAMSIHNESDNMRDILIQLEALCDENANIINIYSNESTSENRTVKDYLSNFWWQQ